MKITGIRERIRTLSYHCATRHLNGCTVSNFSESEHQAIGKAIEGSFLAGTDLILNLAWGLIEDLAKADTMTYEPFVVKAMRRKAILELEELLTDFEERFADGRRHQAQAGTGPRKPRAQP